MTTWFTSDPHLGHPSVAGWRGFSDVETHDNTIRENWERVIRRGDTVWVLGDIALSGHTRAIGFIQTLPGTKHLVAGNHDACHPMHREAHKFQRAYFDAFSSVQAFAKMRVAGQFLLLSHFPYVKDRTATPRHAQWRLPDFGWPLLHGHTHDNDRGNSHEIHVGLDAWAMNPVHLDQVMSIIEGNG